MAQKLVAKGGTGGGTEWDDGHHEGISQIYIREGCEGIESIKFDYVKNEEPKAGPIHGGSGQSFTESVRRQTFFHMISFVSSSKFA